MSKLYIASKPVALNKEHLYLVFDPNDIFDGDELVIRGGPVVPLEGTEVVDPDHGNIFIDAGRKLIDSADRIKTGETPTTQNFTELKLPAGQSASVTWDKLVNFSKSMGAYNATTQRVETTYDYAILGSNSNSTIGVILSGGAGINVHETLPKLNGTGAALAASTFTGLNHLYVTGAGSKTITIADNFTDTFYDSGTGNTTLVIDAAKISAAGIRIITDDLATTTDKIVLKNVDPTNLLYWSYNGTDLTIENRQGDVIATVINQLGSSRKMNSVEVQLADGSIVPFALPQTKQELPQLQPRVPQLPDWAQFSSIYGQVGAQKMSVRAVWSPLVLDLDGDGIETTKLGYGTGGSQTYFDMDANGTIERTGWITGGDGLLMMDRNGNGLVDNQSELFGNNAQYADGFANLKSLDSNNDNLITNLDADFGGLRVWIDRNENGVLDRRESLSLTQLGITEINLNATQYTDHWGTYRTYNNENLVTAGSTFTMNGVTKTIEDVWFARDVMNTQQTASYTLDARTLFLPTLKGFGGLQDLHVAMSTDATLLTMVQNFVTTLMR
jgi:hypothetical protein